MLTYTNPIVQRDLQEICSRIDTAAFDGKTILVTGANSMLGTYMAYLFLYMADKLGLDVRTVVLTRSADKTRALYADFIGREYFGIIDSDITHTIAYDGPLDYIYHFAGNASPRFINTDPVGILQSNLTGTFNVMELAREKKARVIFASTREVYGALDLPQLSEHTFGSLDPMDNRSCYPESKRAAESILRAYHLQHGVESISARIAHCYGPGMKTDNDGRVMADFIGDAISGRDITLNSSGDAVRAFCYISDATTALALLAIKGESGTAYNLSNESEPLPIREIARIICECCDRHRIEVRFSGRQSQAGYCTYRRVALDNSRLTALGFIPMVSLREGITRTLKSFEYDRQ
ncbi:NAD-dependent epimerase/dehydratase family protein [Duncaniella muricolitica]|jgi:nucleoside-diphosphate-sugar epimerase|uniref:NAD-dependent epimerase/dehydratase family protein n=1 Tax=Duncaniella muricolitica TaxID=2880704 RepID=UPI00244E4F4B|nr:NAD-dependent epimerase/dehydratase family protein [Duncaniella muricolitica]